MRIGTALVAVVAWAVLCNLARAQDPPRLNSRARAEIGALLRAKALQAHSERKLSSRLWLELRRRRGHADAQGVRTPLDRDAAGRVTVDVRGEASRALALRIAAAGGEVESRHARYGRIRARVPLDRIEELAADPDVDSVLPAERAFTNKVNTSAGDQAHRADLARSTFGVDGSGVFVCSLSDGVASLAAVQSTGDLPGGVVILPGQAGSGSEGTAMMEIIYDLAPGAQLGFGSAFGGRAQFAQNILDLRTLGCDIINDDVFYLAEPVFQDGIIADAVDTVVADGALYFSSAGNAGNLNDGTAGVWQGDFRPIAALPAIPFGAAHDFGELANYNLILEDPPFGITLNWSDPMGASNNDYDLFLLDPTLTTVVAASLDFQDGDDDPYEELSSMGVNDTGAALVIVLFNGEARHLHLNTHRGELGAVTDGQISGHAAAAGAFAVAAVGVGEANGGTFVSPPPPEVEPFSSDGPRRIFYSSDGTPLTPGDLLGSGGVVRMKPDLTAADGVATATPGFELFFGTSAAAPHAAAIAALLREREATLSSAELRALLGRAAVDIEATGQDRDSGYGIADAVDLIAAQDDPVQVPTLPGLSSVAAAALLLAARRGCRSRSESGRRRRSPSERTDRDSGTL